MIENISDFILNLLPGNNKFFYIYYLVFIFVFSLLLIFYFSKKVKKSSGDSHTPKKEVTLYDLLKIVSYPNSTIKDLLFAANYFEENFSVDMDEKKSFEFFKKLLNHKNRKKEFFDIFHGKILPKNLKYKNELDKIEKEALNNKEIGN